MGYCNWDWRKSFGTTVEAMRSCSKSFDVGRKQSQLLGLPESVVVM
jgi:hypothetical protein